MSKNKYVNVGIVNVSQEPNEDGSENLYIKLSKDVEIKIDGDKVSGGYLSMSSPVVKYDRIIAKAERDLDEGKIDEEEFDKIVEEADEKAARYEEGGDLSYIRHELTYVRKDA